MRVFVIQNSERSGAGYLGEYLTARRNASITTIGPHALDDSAPELCDLLVVLGSSHAAYEDVDWIHRERALIRATIAAGIPTIGICFGAQIIAAAIGGASAPLGRMYTGWYENDVPRDSVWFGPWLRWHGDGIMLPPEADVLARHGETIQAFRRKRAVGVQFHPEANAATLQKWIDAASADLRERIDVAALLRESHAHFAELSGQRDRLFGSILELIGL
jgi:GMP synthase (glutamine-hydrolysing)